MFLSYSNNSRAKRYYNIGTQTVMEFANVVVDDHSDFLEFSKEEAINNFTDEAMIESVLDEQVEEPTISVAIETRSRQSSSRKIYCDRNRRPGCRNRQNTETTSNK